MCRNAQKAVIFGVVYCRTSVNRYLSFIRSQHNEQRRREENQ